MPVLGVATSLDDALLAMQQSRVHVAVVTDEEGRTAGIVTLEDVIEALVGDIRDESDR
jgi:CBS domain containing-hemolysin-like protein